MGKRSQCGNVSKVKSIGQQGRRRERERERNPGMRAIRATGNGTGDSRSELLCLPASANPFRVAAVLEGP